VIDRLLQAFEDVVETVVNAAVDVITEAWIEAEK
jgi:hypothetical protein